MLPTIVRKRNYVSPSVFNGFFGDDYLSDFFSLGKPAARSYSPSVNVQELEKEYRIDVAAPGLEREDLKVSVEEGVLTISSEKESSNEEKNEGYLRKEFGHYAFKRSFTLPDEVDAEKISAKHKNGIVSIHLPKTEVKVNPAKTITIS